MRVNRRGLMKMAAGTVALGALKPMSVFAQSQIGSLVVPFGAAGPADTFGRMLAEAGLGSSINKRYVLENKPGAGGNIGTAYVARQQPDGGTLLFTATNFVQSAAIYTSPGYDPITGFTPISKVATTILVLLVTEDHPARTFEEFIAMAKTKPMTYASAGVGSSTHLYGFMLFQETGVELTHVAYKGESAALTDLLGGRVDAGFFAPITANAHLQSGRLRALAVTGKERWAKSPETPTLLESGIKSLSSTGWFGLFGPAGMSAEMASSLAQDVKTALAKPNAATWMAENEIYPFPSTPSEFAADIQRDYAFWKDVAKRADVSLG